MKRMINNNLYEVLNKDTNKNEVLKVIVTDKLNGEDVERFLFYFGLLCSLQVNELLEYSIIPNKKDYILFLMPKLPKCLREINPVEFFSDSGGIFDIIMPICNGTMKMHENSIINGNLNPYNILLTEENEVKISDYCKNELYKNSKDKMTIDIEKIMYMSPEMIENKELSDRSDIWSIGCILYFLLSNKEIFEGKSIYEIMNKIMKCKYTKLECEFSIALNNLLKKILIIKSNKRLSISELISELRSIYKYCNIKYIYYLIEVNDVKEIPTIPFEYNSGIIGIDLGISSSMSGKYKEKVEVVSFYSGNMLKNCVYYNKNDNAIIVGDSAKSRMGKEESNIIYDSQKFIGLSYDDPIVQEGMKKWKFKVVNEDGIPKVELVHDNKLIHLSASDITSEIVKCIKIASDEYLDHHNKSNLTKAVITYPLHFSQKQIFETKEAAERASIEIIDLIPETIAVIIAYLYENQNNSKCNILVYNFTKTRLDVTVCNVDYDNKLIKIIGYEYDLKLGGDDIDNLLVNYFLDLYEKKTGKSRNAINPKAIKKLLTECEKAKCSLSSLHESEIDSSILEENDIHNEISRELINEICENIFKRTMNIVENVLDKCKLSSNDISYVILSGGSTRIPRIKELLEEKFYKTKILNNINICEEAARGATVYGNVKELHFRIENYTD